jgi:CelD/BcsL family acetyltransferase involved in cellulose biosynthesis/peptidoglycan/xylan/chitin deacetylase (PgdA/CDA1 family)
MTADRYRSYIITDPARLESLKEPWNRLLSRHPAPEAFYGIEWSLANLDVPDTQLLTVVTTFADEVVGIAPLCCRGRTIDFVAAGISDYNDILCTAEDASTVLEITLRQLSQSRRNSRICLSNIREDSLVVVAARRSLRTAAIHLTKICNCPCIRFGENKEDHLRSLYSKKSLVRHARSLEKKGKLSFHVFDRYADAAPHLDEYFAQQVIRRAASGQWSAYSTAGGRERARMLMRHQSTDGSLRIAVLRLNGRAIAYHYGFVKHGKYYWYKPSFDITFWDDSPGEVLMHYLLLSLKNESIREFDFTIGEEPFKDRFANARVACYLAKVYPAYAAIPLRMGERLKRSAPLARGIGHGRKCRARLCARISRVSRVAHARLARITNALRSADISSLAARLIRQEIAVGVYKPGALMDNKIPLERYELVLGDISILMQHMVTGCDRYSLSDMPALFQRFRRGDRVAILRHGDQLVHVSWYALRDKIDISYELGATYVVPLPSPHMLIYDCWTKPSYRGQGIYPAVLMRLYRELSAIAPVCIYVRLDNEASVKGIEKAGFIKTLTVCETHQISFVVTHTCFRRCIFMSRLMTALDLIRHNCAPGARVLCYHTVIEKWVDKRIQWPVSVSLAAFERHIEYLRKNYEIVPLDEITCANRRGRYMSRMVAITFDDGYMSNYRIVYPYLKSRGIPFSVFVCTGYLSSSRRLPAFVARCAVYRNPHSELSISSLGRVYALRSDNDRERAAASLAAVVRSLSAKSLASLSEDLVGALGPDIWQECMDIFDSDELMEWKHVVELARSGITMGVHTRNHVIIKNCISAADYYEEVTRPKDELNARGIHA